MDKINLNLLSESDWEALVFLKKATIANLSLEELVAVIDSACHDELSSHEADRLLQVLTMQLLNQFVAKLLNHLERAKSITVNLSQAAVNQLLKAGFDDFVSIDQHHCWISGIPQYYVKRSHYRWVRWVLGIEILQDFLSMPMLRYYYWLGAQLQLANASSIISYYRYFLHLKHQIIAQQKLSMSNAYFWQFMIKRIFRLILRQLDRYEDHILAVLKEKYRPDAFYIDVGRAVLLENGMELVNLLYTAEEQTVLRFCWQAHFPNLYEVMNAQKQSLNMTVLIECMSTCINTLPDDANECRGMIIWIDQHPEIETLVAGCFQQSIRYRPDFWLQYSQSGVSSSAIVQTLLDSWYFDSTKVQTMKPFSYDVMKVHPRDLQHVFALYQFCQDPIQVKSCDALLSSLSILSYSGIAYKVLRISRVLWQSVSMMICLPSVYHIDYLDSLRSCFIYHSVLPDHLRRVVEAYMAVLGRYTWVCAWSPETIQYICLNSRSFAQRPWQMGMDRILAGLNLNKGEVNNGDEERCISSITQ